MNCPTSLQGPKPNLPQRPSSAPSRRTPPAPRAQTQHLQRSSPQRALVQRHQPPIQSPRPQFPSRRPLRHQVQAQIKAQAQAQDHAQAQSHARPTQQPPHNVRQPSPSNEIPQSQAVVRQQAQSNMQIVGPFKSLLDNAIRVSAGRIHSELKNLRVLCTRAVCKEQREKELLRKYCETFKQERDVARQTVRVMVSKRVAEARAANGNGNNTLSRGFKRGRDEAEPSNEILGPSTSAQGIPTPPPSYSTSFPSSSTTTPGASPPHQALEPGEDQDFSTLPYISLSNSSTPSPPIPPLALPRCAMPRRRNTQAQPSQRSRSAEPVLGSVSKLDMTTFDVTVFNPTRARLPNERPAKRRRTSGSSDSSASSEQTVVAEVTMGMKEPRVDSPGLGEADMELESDVDTGDMVAKSQSGDTAKRSKPARISSNSTTEIVHRQIEIVHVDIMYVPMNGKLHCRACMIRSSKNPAPKTPTPKSFPTNASWDTLREHCVQEHPEACADVAKLGPGDVYELRRRMKLG